MSIHETAVIDPEATIASDVTIGPYCTITGPAIIGSGTKLISHVAISGKVTIGESNTFYPFCSIGTEPQDLSYQGEDSQVVIGNNNTIREYVSIHRGTPKENLMTKIGNDCMIMAYCHIAHDCVLGDKVMMVNMSNIAGHVRLNDRVVLGGGTIISQFIKIGKAAYIGGGSGIDRDIPNYCTALGNRVRLKGINIIGLRRMGFDKATVSEVVEFYRTMESSTLSPRAFVENTECMNEYQENEVVLEIANFIKASEIGLPPFMS